ncbi:MAG: helix-turn-helix domain-containing protein [Mahellales bacterium]|jgi:Zn-dependent peptidase ImmA (M78 family)/DNA-binding XRE family transcriptional regulator
MFSKNLKYYRLKNSMTKRELAKQLSITPMAISNYENGKRKPDMELLKKMANVLGVRVSDFLAVRNENLVFCHGEFRKNSMLSVTQQEYIRESVEEYFNRFMTIVEILGGDVLPNAPATNVLELSYDSESDAQSLRKHLNLAIDGPIYNLIEILENKGILIYTCDVDNDKFSGMNGFVNGRPYIVINKNMSPERNRSTIVHELSHLMYKWPEDMEDNKIEELATSISGAFLFPKSDAIRELGIRRTIISKDMLLVAQEYGISMYLLVKRAELLGIISANLAKKFYISASSAGWRKNEPVRIENERPTLFEQLVYRAVNENEISMQRGAELLKVPYDEIVSHYGLSEG